MIDNSTIQEYAKKNTTAKIPLESKMVEAYVSALMNSNKLDDCYEELRQVVWNELRFFLFGSLWKYCNELNFEPYRSIIQYSLTRKDLNLFEMILERVFKGKGYLQQYLGTNLAGAYFDTTDDMNYKPDQSSKRDAYPTDLDTTTDPIRGIVLEAYWLEYSSNTTEYVTSDELDDTLRKFYKLLTVVKPARVNIFMFLEPYCQIKAKWNDSTNDFDFTLWNVKEVTEYPAKAIIQNILDMDMSQFGTLITEIKNDRGALEQVWQAGQSKARFVKYDNGDVSLTYECKSTFIVDTVNPVLEQTWGTITMVTKYPRSGARYWNFGFTPDVVKRQGSSDNYFIKICLYFEHM